MSVADLQDAVEYLFVGLGAYLLVAYAVGEAVGPVEVGVFVLGVLALVAAGVRSLDA